MMTYGAGADFLTPRDFAHQIGTFGMPVELGLDTRGRAAESTIATLFGCTLPDVLDDGFGQIADMVDTAVAAEIERYRGETGDIGPISTDLLSARLDFAGLARRGGRLTARFTGSLHGEYNASVVDTNQWGDGLAEHSATFRTTRARIHIDRVLCAGKPAAELHSADQG
jgi:hypothetical protein